MTRLHLAMRQLNFEERKVCDRILSFKGLGNNSVANLIDSEIEGAYLTITREPRSASIFLQWYSAAPWSTEQGFHERLEELILKVFRTLTLIKMLEADGYLMTYRINESVSVWSVGNVIQKGDNNYKGGATNHLTDSKLVDLLIEYSDKDIIITEEFVLFCRRGYRPRDEWRFRRQITIATSALIVAMSGFILNIVLNFIPKMNSDEGVYLKQVDSIQNDSLRFIPSTKLKAHTDFGMQTDSGGR